VSIAAIAIIWVRGGGAADGQERLIAGAPAPISLISTKTSVMLFSAGATPAVRELVDAQGIAFIEWLDDGTRIVGYDWSGHTYQILGIDAGVVDRQYATFAPQGPDRRTVFAHALPGGTSIILSRDDGPATIYDVASGVMNNLAQPAGQNVVFNASPDGKSLMYNNIVGTDYTVMVADADGANARVLRDNKGRVNAGFVDENAVSPDGKWLLMATADGPGNNPQGGEIVTDAAGTTVWRVPARDIQGGIASEVRWAGPDRLLLTETAFDAGGLPVLTATFVAIPSGAETPGPPELATRLVSISPDGRHAIVSLGDGDAAWDRRCALVDIDAATGAIRELVSATAGPGDFQTVFCASVDWTADGTQAVVSAGGI
jgi:hypothetical protein